MPAEDPASWIRGRHRTGRSSGLHARFSRIAGRASVGPGGSHALPDTRGASINLAFGSAPLSGSSARHTVTEPRRVGWDRGWRPSRPTPLRGRDRGSMSPRPSPSGGFPSGGQQATFAPAPECHGACSVVGRGYVRKPLSRGVFSPRRAACLGIRSLRLASLGTAERPGTRAPRAEVARRGVRPHRRVRWG